MLPREHSMTMTLNLDGKTMFVSSTATSGVADAQTRLALRQRGARVLGRYQGGRIRRGVLVGEFSGVEPAGA